MNTSVSSSELKSPKAAGMPSNTLPNTAGVMSLHFTIVTAAITCTTNNWTLIVSTVVIYLQTDVQSIHHCRQSVLIASTCSNSFVMTQSTFEKLTYKLYGQKIDETTRIFGGNICKVYPLLERLLLTAKIEFAM